MIGDGRLLRGMLRACEDIAEFISPGRDLFMSSRLHQAAVIYKLQVIGEAIKLLSPAIRLAHPDFPWTRFVRERNRLVHLFFRLERTLIWDIACQEVPAAQLQLRKILASHR